MSSESRAQFARRCGVSPPAITTAIKRGGIAALPDGDVDKSAPLTVDYWRLKVGEFSGKSIDDELPPKPKSKRKRKASKPGPKKGSKRKKTAQAKPEKAAAVKPKPAAPKPAPVKADPVPVEAPRPPPGYEDEAPPEPVVKPPKNVPAVKSIVGVPAIAPATTRPPSESRQLPLNLEEFSSEHLDDVSKADLDKVKTFQQARTAAIKADYERGKLILRETVRKVFGRIYTVHKSELRAFEDRLTPEICAIFATQEDSDEGVECRRLLNTETTKILRHIQVLIAEYVEETAEESGVANGAA